MSSTDFTILLVDDDPDMLRYLRQGVELQSCLVETAASGTCAIERFTNGLRPQLVLLDLRMPGKDGIETLAEIRTIAPGVPVVMLSGVTDLPKVVRCMQLGARDYLPKPVNLDAVYAIIEDLREPQVAQPAPHAQQLPLGVDAAPVEMEIPLPHDMFFVCASPAMQKLQRQATAVARSDIPILLLGESGTGKEVLGALIHARSHRAHRPFLKVNCAAVPADLLESELFGFEAGAFTGAARSKPGKFEQCQGGTILLDEIGEMPGALQAKLLHVLQDYEFSRLGARVATKVDVRVLSATNINVQEAIANKKLRPDLFYRLNGLSLHLPPLRQRREEIPVLLKHFMEKGEKGTARSVPQLTPRLLEACLAYAWPGNVRELRNFVNRYAVLRDENLAIAELSGFAETTASGNASRGLKSIVRSVKDDTEAVAIAQALRQTNWKRKEAAALLKISYKALLYKMKQLHLQPPPSL